MKPNIIAMIPTGIGCEIGGHAGDATPAMRLLGAVSNRLVLHPNCVNASDIIEMPDNALYVDGYQLDEFVAGRIGLQNRVGNKILVAINPPVKPDSINAVNAARSTLGVDAEIAEVEVAIDVAGQPKAIRFARSGPIWLGLSAGIFFEIARIDE